MKDIKEKPAERMPRSSTAGKIPKAALRKAWTEAKEKSRTKLRESTATQGDGDYTTAQDTGSAVTDTSYSAIKKNTDFTTQQGRKLTRKQIEKYRERHAAEQAEAARAHAAGERGVSPKQAERGTLPDAEQRPRRGADLPRQRAKEKAVTVKTAPRDIRGVTQGQRQLRTAANETMRNVTTKHKCSPAPAKCSLPSGKPLPTPARPSWRCARPSVIFSPACTALSRPLQQASAWLSALLSSSVLWRLCPARPTASFLPPMRPVQIQLPCSRQWKC